MIFVGRSKPVCKHKRWNTEGHWTLEPVTPKEARADTKGQYIGLPMEAKMFVISK
jgi:hypothetical protein